MNPSLGRKASRSAHDRHVADERMRHLLRKSAPASIQNGDAKRALAAPLRVRLLEVAHVLDKLLTRHGLVVRGQVALCGKPTRLNENVGIRCTRISLGEALESAGLVERGPTAASTYARAKQHMEQLKARIEF